MTTQNKNVPALRFSEFNGTWESKKLNEIASIFDGTHQTPKYVNEGVKFVSVENIEDIENTDKFITKQAFEKDFKVKPQTDDILMTRITAGIIGATAIVKNDNPLAYYVSLALIRSKKNTDVKFLNQRINSHQFKHELYKRIIHVAFPKKINLGEIGECEASLPTLPEQQKIAAFLTAVDEKIQQLTKKKDLLEQYKKGVMQQIFSQEIRFKDDNGNDFLDWEEKNLKDITTLITKGTTPKNFTESGINYVKIESLLNDSIVLTKCLYIDEKTHNKELKRSILKEGDLLFAIAGATIGKCGVVSKEILPANTNQALAIIRLREKENLKFVFLNLQSPKMKRYIKESISVGAQPNLNLEQVGHFSFSQPDRNEQQKIATFFTAIDEKINLVNQQLRKTKDYKKGLLQQMFV